jgi:ubiquinone/menaquinone biosynthesis C-methylase UbiE
MQQPSVENYYDGISSRYDKARFSHKYHSRVASREEAFVTSQIGSKVNHALEVGPGTGRFTQHLVSLADELTVCDLSQGMLESVQQRLDNPAHVDFQHLSIERLSDLPTYGKYDVAVAMRIIPHVPDWNHALQTLVSSVRPGGLVIFDLWSRSSWVGLTRALLRRQSEVLTHRLTWREISTSLEKLPIEICDAYRWGYPRIGNLHIDRVGSQIFPSYAYSTIFCCQKLTIHKLRQPSGSKEQLAANGSLKAFTL